MAARGGRPQGGKRHGSEATAGGSVSPDTYGDDTARTVAETDPWRLIGELKAMLL